MDITLDSLTKNIVQVFKRYHVVIYVLLVIGGLGVAVLFLNQTVESSAQSNGYESTANNTSFDQATIDRINQLGNGSDAQNTIDLDKGRVNPFIE